MPEYTRPATWEDVKLVARLLDEQGARRMLIGGYAIAAHGFVRFSEDVDILVDPSPENAKRWIDVMPSACGHGWNELEPYAEERAIDGVRVRVLGLEGLLMTRPSTATPTGMLRLGSTSNA